MVLSQAHHRSQLRQQNASAEEIEAVRVVLAVDEFLKWDPKARTDVLSELGGALDTRSVLACGIVSTLDLSDFVQATTASGRRDVTFVPLTGLDPKLLPFPGANAQVQQVAADCGGHARSLEQLHDLLDKNPHLRTSTYSTVRGLLFCFGHRRFGAPSACMQCRGRVVYSASA
jgi:hypothetical protein